jgi:hypothetical protein
MDNKYTLDAEGNPVPCTDLLVWGHWFETADRQVALWKSPDESVTVSTVFLGLDHSFTRGGPPVLWETMVFGGPLDGRQSRYTSKVSALVGHARMQAEAMARLATRAISLEDE